jgi:hypothetical protein
VNFNPIRITTTEQLIDIQDEMSRAGRALIQRKNADYGDHDTAHPDPFANFRRHGALGILVRMDDKMARLNTYIKRGSLAVEDESFIDTAIDLMNYSSILVGFLLDEQKRREESEQRES